MYVFHLCLELSLQYHTSLNKAVTSGAFIQCIKFVWPSGVMMAVDTVVKELKNMSKPVTTPEEIAQVGVAHCSKKKYQQMVQTSYLKQPSH